MASTWTQILTDALTEINAFALGDPIPPFDLALAQRKTNRIIDLWQARQIYAWSDSFTLYTLTPNHQPHLIGPGLVSPDFAATQRPVKIEGASLVLTNQTPNVDSPILNIRDAAWWNNQRVKSLATNVPTDLYPEYDVPSVALYLWPVPTFAYGLRLQTRTSLQQVTNWNSTLAAPPGYEMALICTLAEDYCDAIGRTVSPSLAKKADGARRTIGINNMKSPRIASADHGTGGGRGGGFNYFTGGPA